MTFCGYEIQTHKNSKERLFIMTRTHTINKRFCFVLFLNLFYVIIKNI